MMFYDNPIYSPMIILDDGHVLIEEGLTSLFTNGVPSVGKERFSVYQEDYSSQMTARRAEGEAFDGDGSVQVKTLSYLELCSLINMNTEIYIQLVSPSTGQSLEFRVVGYETDSHPARLDMQNVILVPNLNSTMTTMGISLWTPQEISQGFDTLLQYVDVGLNILDFAWTVTSLFL